MNEQIAKIAEIIANDAYACTFQTMGQYRSALIKECTKLLVK